MALFGKHEEAPSVHTNAPHDWPHVAMPAWVGDPGMDAMMVTGQLLQGLQPLGGQPLGMLVRRMYDDGILSIPLLLDVKGQHHAVYVYSKADAEAAAHFTGVRTLLRQRDHTNAVYYAPEPLQPTKPAEVLEPLEPGHFTKASDDRPAAEYALFWPTDDDPKLASSPALGHLDRWFQNLSGRFYIYFSMLAETLELGGDDGEDGGDDAKDDDTPKIYTLPSKPMLVGVTGPSDLKLYLHASKEQGLWFAFDTRTPASERNLLLEHLAHAAETVQRLGAEHHAPVHADERDVYAAWSKQRSEYLAKESQNAEGLRLRLISEQGSARVSGPGATSAPERAAAAPDIPEPSEPLLDFVRSELDVAFARVRAAAARGEGGPNLHPFLAAHAGNDVWRTVMPMTEEPDAVAFTPQILAERRDADFVALLCDGYLTIGGERSDALVVHAQERGAEGSQIFGQRYRLSDSHKVELLGNWALVSAAASLWPTESAASGAEPSERLRTFVDERVRQRLDWLKLGVDTDEEAEPLGDDDTLLSPHLERVKAGKSFTNGYMMMGLAAALPLARKTLAEEPTCELASLEFDDPTTCGDRPARSIRFWAQERGTPCAFIFAQAYQPRSKDGPFAAVGSLTLVRPADPLFPEA